ncbi:MAG: dTDP-glucose 4,6-dehydratase [Candidatus Magnetomorum sp.]|nr:dTDP-glucose 4,6-dehydratase [Candidatus Magnetomorum sp.]
MSQPIKRSFSHLMVTGGCGFIGSNFIRYLLTETDFSGKIINVDALTYAGNPFSLKDIETHYAKSYQFIRADICNVNVMETLFLDHQVDAICHFAAESHVDRSIQSPESFIQSNILGTYSLLEISRKYSHQLKLFHHISTDEVFGSLDNTGYFSENSPYQPNSPYSASKAASDHMVRAYGHTYELPFTLSNCSNNFGPYQFPEKLIPLTILNALNNKPLPIYGDGKNVRDWLYVTDHCRAIWNIMCQGETGETYTIGGDAEMQNIQVVRCICDILDDAAPSAHERRHTLITHVKDRPGHDRRYAIDCSKIKNSLGWQPLESFQTGLKKTILWYINNKEWVNQVQTGAYRNWIKQQYHSS